MPGVKLTPGLRFTKGGREYMCLDWAMAHRLQPKYGYWVNRKDTVNHFPTFKSRLEGHANHAITRDYLKTEGDFNLAYLLVVEYETVASKLAPPLEGFGEYSL